MFPIKRTTFASLLINVGLVVMGSFSRDTGFIAVAIIFLIDHTIDSEIRKVKKSQYETK